MEFEVYYDIWSNIHYGYVGRSAKFSRSELEVGQQAPGSGNTDRGDIISSAYGMAMWDSFGNGLNISEFDKSVKHMIREMSAFHVLQVRPKGW